MLTSAILVLGLVAPFQAPRKVPHEWRNVAVVAGGFVTGVIPHPRAKDVVYARTDIGGAYRLDPATRRWIPLQDQLTRSQWTWYGVESVALDPQDPNRVYLAVGTYTNDWGGNGAIMCSGDQGKNWRIVPLPFKNGGNEDGRSIGERLAVDPNDGRILFFGTRHNGLWQSRDRGQTWSEVSSFPVKKGPGGVGLGWVLFDAKPRLKKPTSRILVGPAIPGQPIYESKDAGATWSPIAGSPTQIPHHAELADDGTLYVTTTDKPGPNGVGDGAVWKRSPDGAWTDITPIRPNKEKAFGYAGLSLDRKNPGTLIVSTLCRWGQDTIFRSRDGGKTWISLAEKSVRDVSASPYLKWDHQDADFGHWIGDCEIDPFNPDRVWYVTGATIYETTEVQRADRGLGTRWFVGGVGIEETAVIDLASPPRGMHVMSALGDISGFPHRDLTKPHPGGMLTVPMLNSVDTIDFAEQKPETWIRVGRSYGGTHHGGYSEDAGATWKRLATDPPGSKGGGGSACLTADGKAVLWSAPSTTVHRTTDWGTTWESVSGLPSAVRLVSDRVDPAVVYAFAGSRLFVSSDRGQSFVEQAPIPGGEVRKVEAVFAHRGHLWATTRTGLFRSRDAGASFQKAPVLTAAEAVGFGRSQKADGYPTLFVIGQIGATEGVFRSLDEGATWVQVNDEKTGFGTMGHICGDPKVFGRFYVGTNGRGVLVADPKPKLKPR